VARVTGQLQAAYDALESVFANSAMSPADGIDQAGISTAVAWQFTQQMIPDVVDAAAYPALRAYSLQAEALPEFRAAAHGLGTYPLELGASRA
jgi:hypothetical protein